MLFALAVAVLAAVQDPEPRPAPPSLPAATAEERTAAVEAATRALTELAPRRAKLEEGEWAAAEARLGAAVTAFTAAPDDLEWEHFARCIQATWRTQCPGACAALCELALKHTKPTAALHCQLGMAKYALVQEHEVPYLQRRWAAEAAAAFAASRALGEREPAFVFHHQALVTALDFPGAVAELDAALAHPTFGTRLGESVHCVRAMYLLAADRPEDAIAALAAASSAKEEGSDDLSMMVRALALAGRTDPALAKARAAWRDAPKAAHLTLLVDVLAYAGEFDLAATLLQNHPVAREAKESDEALAERRRARAALEYVVGLRGKRPDDLIPRLLAALEHSVKLGKADGFIVHDMSRKEDEQTSLTDSPPAIASWMLQQASSEFGWANDLLYLACVEAMPRWRANALELALVKRLLPEGHWQEITRPDAVAIGRAMLANHRMLSASDGVLAATKLFAP